MKKTIFKLLCLVMICSCLVCSVSAADNPDYLYDGIEYYSTAQQRGNNVPSNNDVLLLPNDGSRSFTYSFSGKTKQYSDFVISPQTNTTGMTIEYIATSADHFITFKIIDKANSNVVYSEEISVINGFVQGVFFDFTYFEKGRGYYIELSSPSLSTASGSFTISN